MDTSMGSLHRFFLPYLTMQREQDPGSLFKILFLAVLWVFTAAWALSLVVAGMPSSCERAASHFGGFSWNIGSGHGLNSVSSLALESRLSSCGTGLIAPRRSKGIVPGPGIRKAYVFDRWILCF